MKIGIITPVFSIAGVPLAQYRFARALKSQGHSVELVIGHLPTNFSPEQIPGLKINILNKTIQLNFLKITHISISLLFKKFEFNLPNQTYFLSQRCNNYGVHLPVSF